MNILFTVKHTDLTGNAFYYPLGLFYVADSLKRAGHNIFWLEFLQKRPTPRELKETLETEIIKNNIQIVACGSLAVGFGEARDVFNAAKSVNPNIITLGGGALFTHSPLESMICIPSCDYGIIGEGEISDVLLVNALEKGESVENIKGVIYRKDGEIKNNGVSDVVMDLDNLPYPDVSPIIHERLMSGDYALITGSRSCPFGCAFCSLSTAKKYRKRGIDSIISEIKSLKEKYNVNYFEFIDEMFFNQKEFILEFAKKAKDLGVHFRIQSRVSKSIDEECIEKLKDAGMFNLACGIENVDNDILKSMKKGQTAEIYERFFEVLQNTGLKKFFNFILLFGDPAETYENVKRNLDFFIKNRLDFKNIHLLPILCYPGSEIHKNALESGLIKDATVYLESMSELSDLNAINLTKFTDREMDVLRVILNCYRYLIPSTKVNYLYTKYEKERKEVLVGCTCGSERNFDNIWDLINRDCNKCGNPAFAHAFIKCYENIGEKIIEMSKTKKIGIWGMYFLLPQILSEDFTENENIVLFNSLTEHGAEDFQNWEEKLDMPQNMRMSKMLKNHYCYNRISDYPGMRDLDTVVVLLMPKHSGFVKLEILNDNPNINCISDNDLYFA
jgi:radical SAM superfamily enzyme YgiQ (UPF0313 family)